MCQIALCQRLTADTCRGKTDSSFTNGYLQGQNIYMMEMPPLAKTHLTPKKSDWKQNRFISEVPTEKKLLEQSSKEGDFRRLKKKTKTESTKAGLFQERWKTRPIGAKWEKG